MIDDKWLFALKGFTEHPLALVVCYVPCSYPERKRKVKTGPLGREGVIVHLTRPLCHNRSLCAGGDQVSGRPYRTSLLRTTATAHAFCAARHLNHLLTKFLRQQTTEMN